MTKRRILILGAAGRDFHNFNMLYRDNSDVRVMGFTATQIPDIDGRRYPAELTGSIYPDGIPIFSESRLSDLIEEHSIDECVFSYSDISYQKLMSIAATVQSSGAGLLLPGPSSTMLKSSKPVIAVCAVRTGCGKSQTSRKLVELLTSRGLRVVAIRHPMPYGDLNDQKVQRFAQLSDLKKNNCTIEEMEEYEPYIVRGNVIYAGVDYGSILKMAENDPNGCDVIIWDGGNNDCPFIKPDLLLTVTDPHRVGHELSYYPGEVNLKMADVVVINKVDSARKEDVDQLNLNITKANPNATIIQASSTIRVDDPDVIRNKRVLVVEDGPTLTHGEMKFGAGVVASQKLGARELIDPRPFLNGRLRATFETYPDIGSLLPAMGYGSEQLKDLEETINKTDCEGVVIGTPIDLSRVINIRKPFTRVHYDLDEIGNPDIESILNDFLKNLKH